ncbi:MAG TPA: pantetheine-phosphate adenylyltransferase [Bacteroidia bacterium]|jgi:pantetheine-phosphate adenylyltransferase|nr:pantetheine-phosphate adenylyltransferase [Bacteroidia bacterium]
MARIAVFPGSFDPITKGHESIVQRALPLFDSIIVAIGSNSTKSSMFPLEKRRQWIENTFDKYPNVKVVDYSSLTIELCRKHGASYILRGLRSVTDFEYESNIAKMNRAMEPTIETVFMLALPEYSAIHSTIIREIIKNNGDVSQFIPSGIALK